MKKKIVHIITRFINGGAEENTLITCNYSAKKGDKVYLVTGKEIDKEIIRNMISVQIAWNKLISGLYYRLISVSDIEIEQVMIDDSSISREIAYNLIRDRQITLKANKYLRDLKDSSTIEYR